MAIVGKSTNGASSTAFTADQIHVSTFSPSFDGVADVLRVRTWVDSTATTAIGVIYSDNAGSPGDLLAQTDEFDIINLTEDEVEGVFTSANEISLRAGTDYWIGVLFKDPGATNVNFSRDNTAANIQYKATTYASGAPASLTGTAGANGPIDCYVVYRPEPYGDAVDLYDNFNDNSMDATKWGSFGTGVAETSSQLQLTSLLAGDYKGYYSINQWNCLDNEIAIQVVNAGNQALASWQVFPVLVEVDSNNRLTWQINGNVIYAQTIIDGSTTNVFSVAYTAATHAYFKIRERFGITYWETSTDGVTWTIHYQMTTPLDISNVNIQIQAGTYAVEGSTTTAILDNFNVDPYLKTPTVYPSANGTNVAQWTNPTRAYYAGDLQYATSATTGHQHDFSGYGLVVPTGAVIVGIEVKLRAFNTAGTANTIAVALSHNNGTNYTAAKSTATLTASTTEYTLGSASDTWGRSWAASEFANGAFMLRVTLTRTASTANLDYTNVTVYYTHPGETATIENVNAIRRRMTIKADHLFANIKSVFSAPTDNNAGFRDGYIYNGANPSLSYSAVNIGQIWNETSGQIGLIRFDTSALPDNARIRSIRLNMYGAFANNVVTDWFVEARALNFGHRIDADDWWKTTEVVDTLPLVAVAPDDEIKYANAPTEFMSTTAFAENVRNDGFTTLMLVSSRLVNDIYGDYGGSSSADYVTFYTPNDDGFEPELIVEYDDETSYATARDARTEFRLYDKDDVYIRTLKTIANDYSIAAEINAAGASYSFTLAEDSEDVADDLIIGAIVKVHKYDQVRTDGIKIYEGRISAIKAKKAEIEIATISRTADMQRQPFEKVVSTTSYGTTPTSGTIQSKTLAATTNWVAQGLLAPYENLAYLDIWSTTSIADDAVLLYSSDGSQPSSLIATPSEVRSLGYDNSVGMIVNRVYFATTIDLIVGQLYFVVIKGARTIGQGADFASGVSVYDSSDSGATWAADTTKDIFVRYYFGNYSTSITYTDTDPSHIVRDVIDAYRRAGGVVSYDGGSVLFTNDTSTGSTDTNITLKIQNVSILDALRKALEYAPADWYFYVDVAENKIYFKKRSDTPDFTLRVGENVADYTVEIGDRDLVNVAYFSGGDDGSGNNLYIKGTKQGSVDEYGRYAATLTDNRVTNSATALKAINKVLSEKGNPTIDAGAVIVDVPINGIRGYVIENLQPGLTIAFTNIGTYGVQVLDSMILDDAWLDYKLYDYSTFVLQIVKTTHKPDSLEVVLETARVEITKVMNEQTKKIRDRETVDNPVTPE
jgi:hypothetical protein